MSKPQRTSPEGTTAPPTIMVLVRHGVTPTTGKVLPGRAGGLHLSETGRAQAKAVAQHIMQIPNGHGDDRAGIGAVYASPLERTLETAEPIAEATDLETRPEPGLLELDMGEWTGMELDAARKQPEWSAIQRYPSGFRFPGGESFVEMQSRIVATVDELRRRHPGEVVVAVSHADPIRALTAHALGTHLDLFQRLVVSPCSLTVIAYGGDGPAVVTVNSTDTANLTES